MNKNELRKEALKRRDLVSFEDKQKWSEIIVKKILESDYYKRADIVLSYASFRSEVDTEKLNYKILQDGKKLYLPKTYVEEQRMEFFLVQNLDMLCSGYQGIKEPIESENSFGKELISGKQVLMLMPGVAFDSNGNRIGYGGGYYDRYLSKYGNRIHRKMLLAYSCQKVENIKAEQCDISPDEIIQGGHRNDRN